MLLIFLPNSQIFCKSKWHILKMYMTSAVCVHFSDYILPAIISTYWL